MSIKDELDRARKEKEAESKLKEDVWNKKREILSALLDESLSNLSTSLLPHIIPILNSVKSFNVIESLIDLHKECGLIYDDEEPARISCGLVSNYCDDNLKSKDRSFTSDLPISEYPRVKVDYYRKYFSYGLRSVIEYPTIDIVEPAMVASSLVDFKNGGCYQDRLNRIEEAILAFPDFDLVTQGFRESLNFLTLPPIRNLTVKLTWNYYYHRGGVDDPSHEEYSEIQVALRPDLTSISRLNGLSASIATNKCTPSWVKQQLANVYVKPS